MAPPTIPLGFAATQWRLICSARARLAAVATVVLVAFGLGVIAQFLSHFASIFWPLAFAGVLALVPRALVLVFALRHHRPAAVAPRFGLFRLVAAA